MKNATPNGSSTNHLDSEKYNKTHNSGKPNFKQNPGACYIGFFDEQVVLSTLQSGQSLDQYNIIVCPAGHEHNMDIAPLIKKLREAGYAIDEHTQMWKGDCPILGKGKAINLTLVYSCIDTTRSAAND